MLGTQRALPDEDWKKRGDQIVGTSFIKFFVLVKNGL
jgi:hypothetical protein